MAKKTGNAVITAKIKSNGKTVKCKVKVVRKEKPKSKVLVAYFSCSGTTKGIAEKIGDVTGGELYRIEPSIPYTEEDLDYTTNSSRTGIEQNDVSSRPEITGTVNQMQEYQTVLIGYPIWHGKAPRILCTFMEQYDWSGKTIIPFCTSASSGIGNSATELEALCKGKATWLAGKRFSKNASDTEISDWIHSYDVFSDAKKEADTMLIQVGDQTLTAALADNSSAKALAEKLKNGAITIFMHDYANFEKVGSLGFELPTNNEQITTEPGDLILYQGNQFVIYYHTNSWNFTRLGKIEGATTEGLLKVLGEGDVTVTLSLKDKE